MKIELKWSVIVIQRLIIIVDLELGLHRWDKNGNGVLDGDEIESLPDYMPDPPTPDQLKQFDFDLNGSLDIDELKIALGYKPYPSGIIYTRQHSITWGVYLVTCTY